MIKINYGTNQYFEENVWDKYYCKSFASAKRELKRVINEQRSLGFNDDLKTIIKEYDKWMLNKRTCFSGWDCQISVWNLHIFIEEIILT